MFSALLYLQSRQTANRLVSRLRRLRQPKYLLGALVGGFYLYFSFFRNFLLDRPLRSRRNADAAAAVTLGAGAALLAGSVETLGAIFLLGISLLAWLLPKQRTALVFSEAEIAFLFPAPISRRSLIHFRLLRSQLSILFSIVILTLLTGRFRNAGVAGVAQQVVGWWILLSTLSLHSLGLSFARSLLLERGVSNWRRRAVTLLAVSFLLGGAWLWAHATLPTLDLARPIPAGDNGPRAVVLGYLQSLETVVATPPLHWILWPFRLPLRPFLASDSQAFLLALGPALALLAAHYAWILRADVAFEESSIAVSRRHAERVASVRAGKSPGAGSARRRRDPFPLRPTGPRLIGIVWKNLLAAGPLFNLRPLLVLLGIFTIAFLVAILFFSAPGAAPLFPGFPGLPMTFASAIALEFFLMLLLFGAQMTRNDLRQDLANVELLKTYPLPGWQIALGELLAPTILLTVLQWVLLLVVLTIVTLGAPVPSQELGFTPQMSWALAVALIAPPFNFLSLTIPNAAVLLLPAWFQTGPGAPQGVEVLGQRLIFFLGQVFVLAVTLLPALGTGLAVYFAARFLGGSFTLATLVAPVAAALVLVGEGALALVPLGRWFDSFDTSADPAGTR